MERVWIAPDAPLILLEEWGSDVRYAVGADGPWQEIDSKPPRAGIAVAWRADAPVRLRLRDHQSAAQVKVHSGCMDGPTVVLFAYLDQLYQRLLHSGGVDLQGVHGRLQALQQHVIDPEHRAWLALAEGNVLYALGRQGAVGPAFDAARRHWQQAQNPGRAAIAQLASAEAASAAGAYPGVADALHAVQPVLAAQGLRFHALRAAAAYCLLQTRLGQLEAGLACEIEVTRHYAQMGESAEAGSRHISIANQSLKLHRLDDATDHLHQAAQRKVEMSPEARARLSMAFGNLHLQQFELDEAARELGRASREYARLGLHLLQSVADVRLAKLAGLAGAEVEERLLLQQVIDTLSMQDGADHVTAASLRLADRLSALGDYTKAAAHRARAQTWCARMQKVDCLERVALAEMEADLAQGRWAQVDAALQRWRAPVLAESGARVWMIRARSALAQGDPATALALLRNPPAGILVARIEAALLEAEALRDLGQHDAAIGMLVATLQQASGAAQRWAMPPLRLSLRARLAPVHAALYDLLGAPATGPWDAARWQRLTAGLQHDAALGQVSELGAPPLSAAWRQRVSEAVQTHPTVDPREVFLGLLDMDASSVVAPGTARETPPSTDDARIIIIPLLGLTHAQVLRVDEAGIHGCVRQTRAEYLQDVRDFEALLAGAPVPLQPLEARALRWFRAVQDCGSGPRNRPWSVWVTPATPQLPWAWIAAQAIVEGLPEPELTLQFRMGPPPALPAAYTQVHLLDLNLAGDNALPAARLEGQHIERALARADAPWPVLHSQPRTVRELLQTFGSAQAAVHVMGHGNPPERGPLFAGLWYQTETDAEVLTYADIARTPLQAELVVLSACGAGPVSDSGRMAHLQLADAFLSAGTRHVIAASNAISDSATPVWTRHFYQALPRDRNPATALRQARAALRASPHFSHPRFWAGLNHYHEPRSATPVPHSMPVVALRDPHRPGRVGQLLVQDSPHERKPR